MKALRIAMVAACPFPSPQGSQVLVAQMCERLARCGHEVHLLTYGQGRAVADRGYVHHRIPRLPGDDASRSGPRPLKPLLDALMARALARLLGGAPFDVVHAHNYEAAVAALAARAVRDVPVVYHSHNLMGDELATYFTGGLPKAAARALGRAVDAVVPRAADHVVALCELTADVLGRRGVAAQRMTIIPPALDDEGPAASKAQARAALGLPLPENAEIVGYCGNLDAYQNLDLLLDAVSALVRRRPVRLLVATHDLDARFEAAVAARGLRPWTDVVRARGWREARSAMEACDVLVLPRRRGSGWPVKLLNYLSLGRPVVAAGCGAKVLRPGVDALLVPDDDAACMAAAIADALASGERGERIGAAGRARFLRDFTWDAVLPVMEGVYARCVGPKPLPTGCMRYNVKGWES